LRIDPKEISESHLLCDPVGCEACRQLGYRGRVAMSEILAVSEGVHDLILKRASSHEIRDFAIAHGMRTLQASGWELAKLGITSLNEVMDFAELMEAEKSEAETARTKPA
jgi:type II secretory ATPase GspE/PulE/Tfp pilus assembly ATPase PilB-like protein